MRVVCVEVKTPPPMDPMTHWGLDVPTREYVDNAHAKALELKEEYEIQKVLKPHMQHGVYSFYMQDRDNNWWEIQYTEVEQTEAMFARGDQPDLGV